MADDPGDIADMAAGELGPDAVEALKDRLGAL
jgi:hypothetical protein